MTDEQKEPEFEDLANLSFEEVINLYNADNKNKRNERHALRRDVGETDPIIKNALNKIKSKLGEDTLKRINRANGAFGFRSFPHFSREIEFNGRQHRTGGGYYEELIFLPDGVIISNFVKKYGKGSDFWKSVALHKAMKKINGIQEIVTESPAYNQEGLTITYSHACFGSGERNLADKIKGKTYNEASEIIKKAIDANLKFSLTLTKNKREFEKPLEEQIFTGQRYFFDTIKSIDKIVDNAMRIIAPDASFGDRRKINRIFRDASKKDRLYVVPGDAQLENTVEDAENGAFKVCDFDYFNQASIHRLLVRLLEKLGPAQLGEMDFVDYAYEKLCELEGRNADEKELSKFRMRHMQEKPAENLLRAARTIEHMEILGEKAENREKLRDIANIYYNRALRDLHKIGESKTAWHIGGGMKVHPILKYLSDRDYFELESRTGINDHGYNSMLLFEKIQDSFWRRDYDDELPFLRKAWNFVRMPVAAGIGIVITLGGIAVLAKSCKEEPFDFKKATSNPFVVERIHKELSKKGYDFARLFNDFDGDIRDEEGKVAQYLDEYLFAVENDMMVMPHENYVLYFGRDNVERSKGGQIGKNWNTSVYRIAETQAVPPQFIRAAIHASSVKWTVNSKAKQEGYVGNYIVLPVETIRKLDDTVYDRHISEDLRTYTYPEFLFNAAAIAMSQNFGSCNEAEIFARLFAGDSAVDSAIMRAKSNEYIIYSKYLPTIAIELSDRAIAYFPFMNGDATLIGDDKFSYAPLMESWITNYEKKYNTKLKRLKLPRH